MNIVPFKVPGGIRCGVLGCGVIHQEAESRIYRIGQGKNECVPACPGCWDAFGIPMDIRDTNDLRPLEQAKAKPYEGPPCPRRCNLCSDHEPEYATEHHWMLEYGDEDEGTFKEEGFLQCRHCDATRDIPFGDEEFLEAFGL